MVQVNQYIDFNGKLLLVKRVISEHQLKPNFDVAIMREWTMSDKEGYTKIFERPYVSCPHCGSKAKPIKNK